MVQSEAWNQQVLMDCFWAPNSRWCISCPPLRARTQRGSVREPFSYRIITARFNSTYMLQLDECSYNKQSPKSVHVKLPLIIGDVSAAVGANNQVRLELYLWQDLSS